MTVLGWGLFYLVLWVFIGHSVLTIRYRSYCEDLQEASDLHPAELLYCIVLLIWGLVLWPRTVLYYHGIENDEDDSDQQ